jgi:type IV secretory pathway VirB10-like protein
MPEHDPAQLLAAYRAQTGPTVGVEARMLESLHVQIGLPAPPATGAGAGAASTVGGVKLAIIVVGVALTAALGGAVAMSSRNAEPPLPVVAHAPAPTPATPTPTPPPAPATEHLLAPTPPMIDTSVTKLSPEPEPIPKRRRRAAPTQPVPDQGTSLAAEVKLLRTADAALQRGALTEARAELDRHAREFESGALANQARVLGLLLSCAGEEPGARETAARYLEDHPNERSRARIELRCELK